MKSLHCVEKFKKKIREEHPHINLINLALPLSTPGPVPAIQDILEECVDESFYVKESRIKNLLLSKEGLKRIVEKKRDNLSGNNEQVTEEWEAL